MLFPVNVGLPTTLDVHRVQRGTGQRVGGPIATVDLDGSGRFGPLEVNGRHAHEFALTRPDGSVHHFYTEAFPRDDHFVRLLTSLPGTGLEAFTTSSPDTTNLVISRQKEFWGDQGGDNDSLTVDGLELLAPGIAPTRPPPGPWRSASDPVRRRRRPARGRPPQVVSRPPRVQLPRAGSARGTPTPGEQSCDGS